MQPVMSQLMCPIAHSLPQSQSTMHITSTELYLTNNVNDDNICELCYYGSGRMWNQTSL